MKFERPAKIEEKQTRQSYEIAETWIHDLIEQSSYTRETVSENREKITSPEGEEFIIRKLTDSKDPFVKKMHRFMTQQFGKEESETLYWVQHTIKEKLNNYHVIETPDGKIASYSNTQFLEVMPREENKPKDLVIFVAHVVTNEAYRGKGLIKELYRTFYREALENARQNGYVLKGVVGEAVPKVEVLLNKMGRRRLYYEDREGNVHEYPYLCPPVDMNDDTGEPLEPAKPEHFMARFTNNEERITMGDFAQIIKSIYTQYAGKASDYNSPDAHKKALENILRLLEDARRQVEEAGGVLFFMSAEERKMKKQELAAEGKTLYELKTEADV